MISGGLRRPARGLVLPLFLLALGACGPAARGPVAPGPAASPSPTVAATLTPTSAASPPSRAVPQVTVIVMENKSYREAMAAPFTSSLAARYAVATNYRAVSHPSLPNYLAITSGSTFGITDDAYHRLAPGGVGSQLTAAGVPWHAYMEGMTAGCDGSPYPYALKHNPFAYYRGACPANVTSAATLAADLAGGETGFIWLTPGLCNDTHDCPVSTGDQWLAREVPVIVGSPGWRAGGVLFIVWDEDDGGDNRVPLIVVSPNLPRGNLGSAFDHYALLATIEDLFRVPRLGHALGAPRLPVAPP